MTLAPSAATTATTDADADVLAQPGQPGQPGQTRPAVSVGPALPEPGRLAAAGSLRIGPVEAAPYAWPYDGSFSPATTAVVNIDWQVDFCGHGGYVDAMGYDLALTRAGLAPTARLLALLRPLGFLIVHTREGHARTWPTARRTSCGARSGSAPASVIVAPAGASSPAANPAGRSSRRWRRCPARW